MFGITIPSGKFFFWIPLFYPLWGVSDSTANQSQRCIGTLKDSVAPNTHPAGQPGSSGPARMGRPAGSKTRSSACSPCMHGARWGHRPVDRGAWWEGLPLLCPTLPSQHLPPSRDPQHQQPQVPTLSLRCSRDPGQLTSSRKGLVVATMDRPRDMFTASGGTEGTDV